MVKIPSTLFVTIHALQLPISRSNTERIKIFSILKTLICCLFRAAGSNRMSWWNQILFWLISIIEWYFKIITFQIIIIAIERTTLTFQMFQGLEADRFLRGLDQVNTVACNVQSWRKNYVLSYKRKNFSRILSFSLFFCSHLYSLVSDCFFFSPHYRKVLETPHTLLVASFSKPCTRFIMIN